MVYRLVSGVYVMAVAPAVMNIFFSTQLVNSIVHQLCTINRGINLTPEKLTGRFPEASGLLCLLLCLLRTAHFSRRCLHFQALPISSL